MGELAAWFRSDRIAFVLLVITVGDCRSCPLILRENDVSTRVKVIIIGVYFSKLLDESGEIG
jgi:hypothetical protein